MNRHRIKNETSSEQASGPFNKHDKTYTNLLNLKKEEVINFFKNEFQNQLTEKQLQTEAEKFYNHNKATGWMIGGKTPIKDWQAAAQNWMQKALEIKTKKANKPIDKLKHLKTNRNKNYDTPL